MTWNPGYSPTTNQVNGATYDANGNMTNDGLTNAYTWNEFSKMASVNKSGTNCATSGECLVYDALGRMAEFDSGSTYTEIWYTQIGKTAFMNGNGQRYSYWPTPGGGTLLQSGGSYYYQHEDWLGSARISSSVVGRTIIDDRAYAPYGEVYNEFGSLAQNETMFGAITQDVVSGTYDTPNRELAGSNQGRWLSPDPAGSGWNQYAYVSNNPLILADPSGLCPTCDNAHWGTFDSIGSWEGSCFVVPTCSTSFTINGIAVSANVALAALGANYLSLLGYSVSPVEVPTDKSGDPGTAEIYPYVGMYSILPAPPANNGSFTKEVLPEGPYTNLCHAGQVSFLAPASFDLSATVAAGNQNVGDVNLTAANAAVGHGGNFDFQRSSNSAGDTIFYSGYSNVSNFAVGAYLYGTGLPQLAGSALANTFAFLFSSNVGDPNQALYRNAGYQAAASGGQISCSRFPWGP